MMLTRSRARSIGWALVLAVCFALTMALSFRVNAVRSQVRLTERRIAQLQAENGLLETEFETRANQQQLTSLNEVEFGYQAPTPGQYLESERQLADLGKARGPDAPPMIRVAAVDPSPPGGVGDSVLPPMVNPLTGKAIAAEAPRQPKPEPKAASLPRLAERDSGAGLAERLSRVEQLAHVEKSPRVIAPKPGKAEPKLADRMAPGAPKQAKAEPKQAKAEPKQAKAEPKQAKAEPKASPKLAKAVPAKPAAKVAVHEAAKSPGKRPGKSDRVAIE